MNVLKGLIALIFIFLFIFNGRFDHLEHEESSAN